MELLDDWIQHSNITSSPVKLKATRKGSLQLSPQVSPGSGLSATRENNNHHQAKRTFLQAHVGDCWRLVVTGALVFSHSTRSQNLGIWRAGKTYDILEVAGDETQDPTWIGKDHLCTKEYSCIMLRQVRVPSLSIGNTGPWILNAWDLSALTTKSSWLPRLSLGVARGGWR